MKSIKYLNYKDLTVALKHYKDEYTSPIFKDHYNQLPILEEIFKDPLVYNHYCVKELIAILSDFCCRSNISKNPFNRHLEESQIMPAYNDKFNKSISDICDERALDIQQKILDNNKKLIVQWSGGIDSTVALVSILKNFSKEALEQIEIACSHISIMENNSFYLNHIHNKVKITHNNWKFKADSDFYFLDGEPGDFLFGSEFCINSFMSKYPTKTYDKWSNNMPILRHILKHNENTKFANWFINEQIENFQTAKVPVENTMEFFWWINFDNRWLSKYYAKVLSQIKYEDINDKTINKIQNYGINFFNSLDFQQWSMSKNNTSEKIIKSITDYKMPLKKYIYEFDKNEFYLNFKTKVNSNSLFPKYEFEKPIIIMGDNTVFNTFNITRSVPILQELLSTRISGIQGPQGPRSLY